jgi:hypothetical protein
MNKHIGLMSNVAALYDIAGDKSQLISCPLTL